MRKTSTTTKLEAKRRVRRKKKVESNSRIWLIGSREWKDKRSVKKVLSSFDYQKVDFVLLGTAPGLEQLALSVSRQLKFNVLLMPPNLARDDYNATYFRNYTMFTLLKPTHVFGFHDHIEQSTSTIQAIKLAKAKKIEHQIITTRKKKEDETIDSNKNVSAKRRPASSSAKPSNNRLRNKKRTT